MDMAKTAFIGTMWHLCQFSIRNLLLSVLTGYFSEYWNFYKLHERYINSRKHDFPWHSSWHSSALGTLSESLTLVPLEMILLIKMVKNGDQTPPTTGLDFGLESYMYVWWLSSLYVCSWIYETSCSYKLSFIDSDKLLGRLMSYE